MSAAFEGFRPTCRFLPAIHSRSPQTLGVLNELGVLGARRTRACRRGCVPCLSQLFRSELLHLQPPCWIPRPLDALLFRRSVQLRMDIVTTFLWILPLFHHHGVSLSVGILAYSVTCQETSTP